jgi:hypothetical protein
VRREWHLNGKVLGVEFVVWSPLLSRHKELKVVEDDVLDVVLIDCELHCIQDLSAGEVRSEQSWEREGVQEEGPGPHSDRSLHGSS